MTTDNLIEDLAWVQQYAANVQAAALEFDRLCKLAAEKGSIYLPPKRMKLVSESTMKTRAK